MASKLGSFRACVREGYRSEDHFVRGLNLDLWMQSCRIANADWSGHLLLTCTVRSTNVSKYIIDIARDRMERRLKGNTA